MSEKLLEGLINRHNEIVSRMDSHESESKKSRNYLTFVAITAILGGGGGATALIKNDDDSVKTAIATHVAVYEEWKPKVSEDIGAMQEQIQKLTALTAFIRGGGTSSDLDDDNMRTAIATHVAVYEEWKPEVTQNIDALNQQVSRLREAMIRIQVTMEGLSDNHRGSGKKMKSKLDEVESLLNDVEKFNHNIQNSNKQNSPSRERIKKTRKRLFND